ncbi:cupredoxin domain-containing protein [Taklimakanibacter deserti]|uniref:cupredoxin domain-containing protein n=1 Tax=Taklimakanibacter deserti TaxID=2267839 RepID=UPI000E652F33
MPAMMLSLAAAFTVTAAYPAEAAGMKRTITMVAVEPKGGTTVDKEPFPTTALPEGKGYELKAPNAEGRWEVSTYRWEPSQIIVNQGDEVTLEVLGVNGAEHPAVIDGYDITFTVKRGQLSTVTFTADKAGVFEFRCGIHQPSMTGELIVLPSG